MRTTIPRWISAILLAPALLCIVTPIASAGEKLFAVDSNHIAIKGYDTIAYFTDGKAVKGSSQFEYVYDDATWRFSNAAHREMFVADPDRYMPQYDAYCAACLATKACAVDIPDHPGDPEAWAIVDGKLYMTGDKKALGWWRANSAENIRQANARWTDIQQRYAARQQ
jgi:YHS domain-containing protein